MPRYYFHLTDGNEVLRTGEGLDLLGPALAREEALRLARDLKHRRIMPERNWDGWFVTIVDSHGHEIETVPIDTAPDTPSPPVS
jgi:hypothetical protein